MSGTGRPLVAVVYDIGAVPAGEIGIGLADDADIVFLTPGDSAHAELLRPVMEQFGEIVELSGDAQKDDDLVRGVAPDAVLTFSEPMVRLTARLAAAAGRFGFSRHSACLLTDKARQRQALREAGIDMTRTYLLRSVEDWEDAVNAVGLPAILKPVIGWASKNTYAVYSVKDIPRARERMAEIFRTDPDTEFVLEEFLVGRDGDEPYGDYVSVESICTPTRTSHFVLTGKTPVMPPFRGTGRIWPSHLPADEEREIYNLTTLALQAVEADRGFAHTEIKLTPEGPRIIELNGRISGHIALLARSAFDVNLVWIGAQMALGLEPETPSFGFGGKVHFQYNNLAPVRPARFEAVRGAKDVKNLPGVTAYRSFVRPGAELPGGPGTICLDAVTGACPDHRAVAEVIDLARRTLTFDLCFGNERRSIKGIDLPAY